MQKKSLSLNMSSFNNMSIVSLSSNDIDAGDSFRLEYDLWMVVHDGSIHISSSLFNVTVQSPSFCVFVANSILEIKNITDNFKADLFIISQSFKEDLNISELISLRRIFTTNPSISLTQEQMDAIAEYQRMASRIINLQDNPYKWESLLSLTRAFYYGGGFYFFKDNTNIEPNDSVLSRFLTLVDEHAECEHSIGFYANTLCLTPKYLSRLIKRKTGKTAKEIICSHIVLKAKTLLTNSDHTIQEISEILKFPSQSVFGKFFKQATGLSPKAYRKRKDTNIL